MNRHGESSEMGMVNAGGPEITDQQSDPEPPQNSLSTEELAELRWWIASGDYALPQSDMLIASRILEQGDL